MTRGKRAAGVAAQRVLGERWEGGMQQFFLGLREWRGSGPATLHVLRAPRTRRAHDPGALPVWPSRSVGAALCAPLRRARVPGADPELPRHLSDGLQRLRPGEPAVGDDDIRIVTIELWATAHCFKRGHRLRVQVAGGSHPRYARNPGSGEPLASATHRIAADHTVYHDQEHPSAILLPVKSAG